MLGEGGGSGVIVITRNRTGLPCYTRLTASPDEDHNWFQHCARLRACAGFAYDDEEAETGVVVSGVHWLHDEDGQIVAGLSSRPDERRSDEWVPLLNKGAATHGSTRVSWVTT